MASFDINKYRKIFLEEAQDLFEVVDNILLEAEDSGDMDSETINSLFRSVHTLKGNSASVELTMFAALAHEIEFFMDRLRNGELDFEDSMGDLLIESVDTLKYILDLELSGELDKETFSSTKDELLSKLNSFSDDASVESSDEGVQSLDEDDGFGFLDSEDESFGLLNHNHKGALEQKVVDEDIDDFFGFFDENIEEVLDEIVNDDGFGFFDDEKEELDDDSFGFFQTNEKVDQSLNESNFGFFDDKKEKTTNEESKSIKHLENESSTQSPKDKTPKKLKTSSSSNSIRVDLSKIDGLMNNIGELVIAHSMLNQYAFTMQDQKVKSDLSERLDLLDRYIRELQESVMSVRMIPMETVFSKFPKVIRDTAKKLNKKINFRHYGDSVEIDKAMIEGLTDPLTHIVRNAMDHGLESTDKRREIGKPEEGTLLMSAEQANGQMIIKIQDDGAGINLKKVVAKAIQNGVIEEVEAQQMSKDDKAMLIFSPGLSTAESVTDISGRGVGMDVVMSNIKKLGGVVKVETEEGFGTTVFIVLPLTLAILDGLNIRVGKEQFILPLSSIIESLKPEEEMIQHIGNEDSEILMLREEFIPVVRLHNVFNVIPENKKLKDGLLIVVRSGAKKVALFVDEFMNQQQFVIKPLDKNFRNAQGIGGATVRGDGTIGLIIDTMNIMNKNY